MYRKILLLIVALIFSVSWGIAQQVRTGSEQKATDGTQSPILTLVTSFGDENLPSEYLLAYPMQLQVNEKNDIYIFDEQKIKVYDSSGKPKCIIGGPGEGPGEFGNSFNVVTISPTGFITAGYTPSFHNLVYNIFNPDNFLVKKADLRFNDVFNQFIKKQRF
jgi:hypothetical protein